MKTIFKLNIVVFLFSTVQAYLSETLCSQMNGDCQPYWHPCLSGKYSRDPALCPSYGFGYAQTMCCFHEYWEDDCVRWGGVCQDYRWQPCRTGRMVFDGCSGEYRQCCLPSFPFQQSRGFSPQSRMNPLMQPRQSLPPQLMQLMQPMRPMQFRQPVQPMRYMRTMQAVQLPQG